MKKIFKKFSLLFIGLMLCAGNAWGGYNDAQGYYEETVNGVTFRAYYTFSSSSMGYTMKQRTVTSVTIYSFDPNANPLFPNTVWIDKGSLTLTTTEFSDLPEMLASNPMFESKTNTYAVTIPNNVFNNFTGAVYLPAYDTENPTKNITLAGTFAQSFGGDVYARSRRDCARYCCETNSKWVAGLKALADSNPQAVGGKSGDFGQDNSFHWALYDNDSLAITLNNPHTTTEMPDFTGSNNPWASDWASVYIVGIGSGITEIGKYAFCHMNGDTPESNVFFVSFTGNSVIEIDEDAFRAGQFRSITLPSSLQTIRGRAFSACPNLKSITLPASVADLYNEVFLSSTALSTVFTEGTTAPEVHLDGTEKLFNTTAISTIVIPNGSICDYNDTWGYDLGGSYVFKYSVNGEEEECSGEPEEPEINYSCGTNLTWSYDDGVLTISGTGTVMSDYESYEDVPWVAGSVANQTEITSVVLPNTLQHIGNNVFSGCTNLTSINLPSALTSIGDAAFAACTGLTSIIIPNTVETIGAGAFGQSGLTAITIPASVTSIGTSAFYYASGLKTVTIQSETPCTLGDAAFLTNMSIQMVDIGWGPMPSYTFVCDVETFYVPAGTKAAYLADASWAAFMTDANTKQLVSLSDNAAGETNEVLEELASANAGEGTLIEEFTITRPILANGDLNTLCLPFALSAEQLADAENPLHEATIFQFSTKHEGDNDEVLLRLDPVSEMKAGEPYFFAYLNGKGGSTDPISSLHFKDVQIVKFEEQQVSRNAGAYILHGTLDNVVLEDNGSDYLFLTAGSMLYYLDLDGTTDAQRTIKPFRAYFELPNLGGGANHAPARFVFGHQMPTDIESVPSSVINSQKIIENGHVVIIRNGERYNVAGQKL